MTRTAKLLAVLVGVALVFVLGTGMLAAGTALSSGLMTVSVHEEGPDGVDFFIPVPAGLIEVGLGVAPTVIRLTEDHHGLDADLDRLRVELDELGPALAMVLDEFAAMPDAVLVEVVGGGDEYVRVSKEGRSLVVLVEESGSRVAVRIPARVFRSVRGFLGA